MTVPDLKLWIDMLLLRQSLVLNVVYAFNPAEIADFQDRDESDVVADIAEARRSLARFFREEYQPEWEEQLEPVERRSNRRGMQ